ncbi:hypothetical protein LXL04_031198 [Taraxacum kok-saghyz]
MAPISGAKSMSVIDWTQMEERRAWEIVPGKDCWAWESNERVPSTCQTFNAGRGFGSASAKERRNKFGRIKSHKKSLNSINKVVTYSKDAKLNQKNSKSKMVILSLHEKVEQMILSPKHGALPSSCGSRSSLCTCSK